MERARPAVSGPGGPVLLGCRPVAQWCGGPGLGGGRVRWWLSWLLWWRLRWGWAAGCGGPVPGRAVFLCPRALRGASMLPWAARFPLFGRRQTGTCRPRECTLRTMSGWRRCAGGPDTTIPRARRRSTGCTWARASTSMGWGPSRCWPLTPAPLSRTSPSSDLRCPAPLRTRSSTSFLIRGLILSGGDKSGWWVQGASPMVVWEKYFS